MPFVSAEGFHYEGEKPFIGKHNEETVPNFHDRKGIGQGLVLDKGQGLGQGHGKSGMTMIHRMNTFVQFFGIMFSCTMVTYWLVMLGKKKRGEQTKEVDLYKC